MVNVTLHNDLIPQKDIAIKHGDPPISPTSLNHTLKGDNEVQISGLRNHTARHGELEFFGENSYLRWGDQCSEEEVSLASTSEDE